MDLQKGTNYVGGLPFGLALFCFFYEAPSNSPVRGVMESKKV
jgi:hypothetical protein